VTARTRNRIFTFYSYKGGVGRTMALANVATLLAREGARVLAADWDLEAPGLDRYFREAPGVPAFRAAQEAPGIVDYTHEIRMRGHADWRDYVTAVHLPRAEHPVHLLPAGRRDGAYVSRLQALDWQALFVENDFANVLEAARNDWIDEYDFVLVDSRTGITDIGGICTVYLPDVVVAMFSANHQSVAGVADVIERARARRSQLHVDRAALVTLPLPARDEARTEYEQSAQWRAIYADTFASAYRDFLPRDVTPEEAVDVLRLPNVPYWSFGERLPVLEESGGDPSTISYAYGVLARLMASDLDWRVGAPGVAGDPPPRPPRPLGAVLRSTLGREQPRVMGGIPPRNPHFSGRTDLLAKLGEALASPRAREFPVALRGFGGIGKTQLAAECVRLRQGEYGLVWWIPAESEASVRRSLVALARRMGLVATDDVDRVDVQVTVELVVEQLRLGEPYDTWLLVFDDAVAPDLLAPYLPGGAGRVLVTTRLRTWDSAATTIEVDVFAPAESVEFVMARWAGLAADQALDLAERLGHLPLALDQAAAVHAETGMPLAEYLRHLEESPSRLLDAGESPQYPISLARAWGLAFEKLRDHSPAAAQLLEVCAHFGPSPVAVPVLLRGGGANLPSPLAAAMRSELDLRAAIRDLSRFALARLDPARDLLGLHTLVRALVRDRMEPDRRDAARRAVQEILSLANPGNPDDPRTWEEHAQLSPHVPASGLVRSSDARACTVVLDQIRYAYSTGDYAHSRALAEEAVATWRDLLGADAEQTLRAAFHLGNARRSVGDYGAAREINEDTLQRMRRTLGPTHKSTLRAAGSTAADHRLLGDFATARGIDDANLARATASLGEADPATLRFANNLAIDHRLLGDFEAALQLDKRTFDLRTTVLGPEHDESLQSDARVARDLYGIGDFFGALGRLNGLLPRFHPARFGALQARRDHAVLLRTTGAYAEALDLARTLRKDCLTRLGPRHELSLATATTLFNTLRVCGEIDEAEVLGAATSAGYAAAFGESHPFTLACATDLAVVHRARGDIDRAAELDARTLVDLRRVLGAEHPYTLVCAANHANDHALAGQVAQARELSAATHELSVRTRGAHHPLTLLVAANLALDLAAEGRDGEARDLRARILPLLRQALGAENPERVAVEGGERGESLVEVPPT